MGKGTAVRRFCRVAVPQQSGRCLAPVVPFAKAGAKNLSRTAPHPPPPMSATRHIRAVTTSTRCRCKEGVGLTEGVIWTSSRLSTSAASMGAKRETRDWITPLFRVSSRGFTASRRSNEGRYSCSTHHCGSDGDALTQNHTSTVSRRRAVFPLPARDRWSHCCAHGGGKCRNSLVVVHAAPKHWACDNREHWRPIDR